MLLRSCGSSSDGSSPAYLPVGRFLDRAHSSAVRASMASMVCGVESPNQRMSLLPIPQATRTDFSSVLLDTPDITALLAGNTSDSADSTATDTGTMTVASLFSLFGY
jgi:hypothetical protein